MPGPAVADGGGLVCRCSRRCGAGTPVACSDRWRAAGGRRRRRAAVRPRATRPQVTDAVAPAARRPGELRGEAGRAGPRARAPSSRGERTAQARRLRTPSPAGARRVTCDAVPSARASSSRAATSPRRGSCASGRDCPRSALVAWLRTAGQHIRPPGRLNIRGALPVRTVRDLLPQRARSGGLRQPRHRRSLPAPRRGAARRRHRPFGGAQLVVRADVARGRDLASGGDHGVGDDPDARGVSERTHAATGEHTGGGRPLPADDRARARRHSGSRECQRSGSESASGGGRGSVRGAAGGAPFRRRTWWSRPGAWCGTRAIRMSCGRSPSSADATDGDAVFAPRLLIVGAGPRSIVSAACRELGMSSGRDRERAVRGDAIIYARASAMVLASLPSSPAPLHPEDAPRAFWEEQFGLVLAEGMAAGAPDRRRRGSGAIPRSSATRRSFRRATGPGLARVLAEEVLAHRPGWRAPTMTRVSSRSTRSARPQTGSRRPTTALWPIRRRAC